jgi:uncharacterized protein (TIGR00288 family)
MWPRAPEYANPFQGAKKRGNEMNSESQVRSPQHNLAILFDFENLAIGFEKNPKLEFDVNRILERMVEKGKILVKVAYADWSRYSKYKQALHEAAIELIEIPRRAMTGKNSADIHLCVDAMDLCYAKEHIGTFVIVSGDSDFSPLVSKLKENGKHVIGLSMKNIASDLLVANCDEFIFYEDLDGVVVIPPRVDRRIPKGKREAFRLLFDSIAALLRENQEVLWSSMVKDTMKRKRPSFSESAYGYRTFSDLLEDAEKLGFITLRKNPRSGTYVVVGFTKDLQ